MKQNGGSYADLSIVSIIRGKCLILSTLGTVWVFHQSICQKWYHTGKTLKGMLIHNWSLRICMLQGL